MVLNHNCAHRAQTGTQKATPSPKKEIVKGQHSEHNMQWIEMLVFLHASCIVNKCR